MGEALDDLLRADHDLLDGLLRRIVMPGWKIDAAAAREFDAGLRRHIRFEEDHFFPALKAVPGGPPDRAFESLLIDHEMIRVMLDALTRQVERLDGTSAAAVIERLETYLQGHNRDEEFGVYREAERLLSEGDRADLIVKHG